MKNLNKVHSICKDCAVSNGAIPAQGHQATWWTAHCDICREYKGLCDVSDWSWVEGKQPKSFSIHARD